MYEYWSHLITHIANMHITETFILSTEAEKEFSQMIEFLVNLDKKF